jgi:hypothetical protein
VPLPRPDVTGYGMIDGNNLIVNARSSVALIRERSPQSEWTLIDRTATDAAAIQDRLVKNGLTSEGTATLRITGSGGNASNLK